MSYSKGRYTSCDGTGRNPTFLLRTGYAQVHSITDALAGMVREAMIEDAAPCCGPGDGVGASGMSCGGKIEPDPELSGVR